MARPTQVDKSQTSLRKSPKQERSKDLVTSVMDAATRILESAGVESVTTNRVAQLAGVSIGSLYQYFPGKDAIFARLIERQLDSNNEHYQDFVKKHRDDEPRELVRALMNDIVQLFYDRRVFISTLFGEVGKLKKTREVLYKRNHLVQIFVDLMKTRPEALRHPELIDQQIYTISHAVIGVLQTAVIEDFERFSPDVLREELTTMTIAYLLK